MKRLFVFVLVCLVALPAVFAQNNVVAIGRVKDALTKRDLTNALVKIYNNEGKLIDSIRCNKGRSWNGHEMDTLAEFMLNLPRVDTLVIFDVVCPGYKDKTVSFEMKKPGRRVDWVPIPLVLMERAPRQLKEVTVTSTKIKFYNKGDTIVYNADAFQLAEGSMLDQLIAQLPGAELTDDGQIKVNGQFVESLLLNGKQFMDGNNNLMLENISAYAVKNINVYEGQNRRDLERGNVNAPKVLTMDVRLKKEYNFGLIGNLQGGYGTEDRYLGRGFASWFNGTTRVSFVGTANNLNDNRKPGRNDSWTPEKMPTGIKEYRLAAVDYNYESTDETKMVDGSLVFGQSVNTTRRTTSRINFLPGGDTYDYSQSGARDREMRVSTNHNLSRRFGAKKNIYTGLAVGGNYSYQKNVNSDLSTTFNKEQVGTVGQIIDAIYSDVEGLKLEDILNKTTTDAGGWTKTLSGSARFYSRYQLGTGDNISMNFGGSYKNIRNEARDTYDVKFYNNQSSLYRRNFADNKPHHELSLSGEMRYNTQIGKVRMDLSYYYGFSDRTKNKYLYSLERMNDLGMFGETDLSFDPSNSYESRLIENIQKIVPGIFYYNPFENGYINIRINPTVSLVHRHLDYYRDSKDYRYYHTNATVSVASIFDGMIEYGFQYVGEGQSRHNRHSVRYSYRITPRLPNVEDLIDIVNDSDPMNIYYGNPGLKTQIAHAHLVRWSYSPASHTLNNILYLGCNHTTNNLTRGYTYNTATGVRYNRMYNVNGNIRAAVTNELMLQFGSKKQFSISSETDLVTSKSTDMIGVDAESPELTKVKQNSLGENFKFGWQIGRQTLQLRCDYLTRHTTSTQVGFETLNAYHVNYGVSGIFTLGAGFGLSTDFMCYTRRGYGSTKLDTTDPVWNARLSFCPPRNSHWVINIDGFDLLHKLSNVTYAVTASGRTIAYTNALPRYVLATVQYRFGIQPKR